MQMDSDILNPISLVETLDLILNFSWTSLVYFSIVLEYYKIGAQYFFQVDSFTISSSTIHRCFKLT